MKNLKEDKTNVMRILEQNNINYQALYYDYDPDHVDGLELASKLNLDSESVFKTLITKDNKNNYYVFCVPVNCHLDLKKCAKAAHTKEVEMIHVKDINKVSGYIRGGCSPVGMKKLFPTYIDETAQLFDYIYVSAGRLGAQVKVNPLQLADVVRASFVDLCM